MEGGTKKEDEKFKKEFLSALNKHELSKSDPKALEVITPEIREILLKIKAKVLQLGKKNFQETVNASKGQSHEKFDQSRNFDLATLETDILGSAPIPDKFYMPIAGGKEFLEHVLKCDRCLYALAQKDEDQSEEEEKFFGEIADEVEKRSENN